MEEELLEQEFLERCFQEMLDEEDQDWFIPERDLPSVGQIQQQLNGLSVSNGNAEDVLVSFKALLIFCEWNVVCHEMNSFRGCSFNHHFDSTN